MRTTRTMILVGLGAAVATALLFRADGTLAQPRGVHAGKPRPPVIGLGNPHYWAVKRGNTGWATPGPVGHSTPWNGRCDAAPDVSVCRAPGFLESDCGRRYHETCVTLLQEDARRQYQANATILLPTSMKNGGKLERGGRTPYDRSRIRAYSSANGTLIGKMQVAEAPSTFRQFDASPHPLDPAWERDGNQARSCGEYVYKKYYEYNRFESAAASCRGDYQCIYDLGVRRDVPGLNRTTWHTKQGTVPSAWSARRPPVGTGYLYTAEPLPQLRTQSERNALIGARVKNAFFDLSPNKFVGAAPREAPRYTYTDRFKWHEEMHAKHVALHMTEAEYEDQERRLTDIAQLYATFKHFLDSAGGPFLGTINEILSRNQFKDNCTQYYQHVGQPPPPPPPPGVLCPPPGTTYPGNSPAYAVKATIEAIRAALTAEVFHVDPHDGRTIDQGCLATNSSRCDWSPKLFADEYMHKYTAEREADYQRCLLIVGDRPVDFEANDPPITAADRADSDALDKWMSMAVLASTDEIADIPWKGGDTMGNSTHDGHVFGDKNWFAADYDFAAGWEAKLERKAGSGPYCKASGKVFTNASASIYVLGHQVTIADAEFDAQIGPAYTPAPNGTMNAHAKFLGVPLLPSLSNQEVRYDAGDTGDAPGVHYSVIIPVMGIPVTLKAGADLSYGYTFQAAASAPQDCARTDNIFNIRTTFTPWVGANATASISVDVGIASVGIEGSLNLITVSLPVKGGVRIGQMQFAQGMFPALTLATTAKLELDELGGRIDAFEEVCIKLLPCFKQEEDIYSWHGLHQSLPLFGYDKSYSFAALRRAHAPANAAPAPRPVITVDPNRGARDFGGFRR